jgi:alkylation response protein AidB-like acyl-CoA dehydrogenase
MPACRPTACSGRSTAGGRSSPASWSSSASACRPPAYAKTRQQFGQPIGKFQAVAHKLADMQVMLDISRVLTYRFACRAGMGKTERRDAAVLKLYTGEAYRSVADLGMQILGGYGYIMDSFMQQHYRDSRLATIGGGTAEIQRNIIAQTLGL